jgi:hypothetical protein
MDKQKRTKELLEDIKLEKLGIFLNKVSKSVNDIPQQYQPIIEEEFNVDNHMKHNFKPLLMSEQDRKDIEKCESNTAEFQEVMKRIEGKQDEYKTNPDKYEQTIVLVLRQEEYQEYQNIKDNPEKLNKFIQEQIKQGRAYPQCMKTQDQSLPQEASKIFSRGLQERGGRK